MTASVQAGSAAPMLDGRVRDGFVAGTSRLRDNEAVSVLAAAAEESGPGFSAAPQLLEVAAADLDGSLTEECFGPVTVLVRYRDEDELVRALGSLPASLTATLQAQDDDAEMIARVVDVLRDKVGRLLWNGFPTGVAVAWAQQHGGPYPASTSTHTSVGPTSVRRFLRPITYQSTPPALLPPALRDDNPWHLPRRVDGTLTSTRPGGG
jgi:NADP-dependent aldehyde dehydrogenase